jgi:Mrp family chromosome partitioning ATPase
MNYIRLEREVLADKLADEGRTARPSAAPAEALRPLQPVKPVLAPEKIAPWAKSLVRAIAFTESRPARVIGITGIRRGVGASLIAQGLAQIYSEFDRRVLFVNASTANLSETVPATVENVPDLSALSANPSGKLFSVDLSDPRIVLPQSPEFFRYTFDLALNHFHAIVVDLPIAAGPTGRPTPGFLAVGPACNALFLVCVTGRTTRSEVQQCLASCRISGASVEGVLLNDYRLPASKLLSET